jgi:hypothetical protein
MFWKCEREGHGAFYHQQFLNIFKSRTSNSCWKQMSRLEHKTFRDITMLMLKGFLALGVSENRSIWIHSNFKVFPFKRDDSYKKNFFFTRISIHLLRALFCDPCTFQPLEEARGELQLASFDSICHIFFEYKRNDPTVTLDNEDHHCKILQLEHHIVTYRLIQLR